MSRTAAATKEPTSHALKMGPPLNDMRTKCGVKLTDKSLKGAGIGTTLATVSCVPCRAVLEAENELTRFKRGPVPDELERYYEWALTGDIGLSSLTLVEAITGARVVSRDFGARTPQDASDFGRCSRVLETFPELREKLHLVAEKYPEWAGLVAHWSELEALYAEELPTGNAPRLYARMKELRGVR